MYLAGVSKSLYWLIDYDKLLIKRGHRNSFIYPLFIYLRNPEGSSTTLFCKHFNSKTFVKSKIMDDVTGTLKIQIYHPQSWMACFSQKYWLVKSWSMCHHHYFGQGVLAHSSTHYRVSLFWHFLTLEFTRVWFVFIRKTQASRVLNS